MLTNQNPFSLTELTEHIIKQKIVDTKIGKLKLFNSKPIATTKITITWSDKEGFLVQTSPRGGEGKINKNNKRRAITIEVPHIQLNDAVLAESYQNVAQFGSTLVNPRSQAVKDKIADMSTNLDLTIEYHRLGALKGVILDADGEVIVDLFEAFGMGARPAASTASWQLNTATTKVLSKALTAKRYIEGKLNGLAYSGLHAYCGSEFFEKLITHDKLKPAFERYQDGSIYRDDKRNGFPYQGIVFEEYTGAVGATQFLADTECYIFPIGVTGLFRTYYAPADYNETVNTLGLPKYAKAKAKENDKGYNIEVQTNPLNICNRPEAIYKATV